MVSHPQSCLSFPHLILSVTSDPHYELTCENWTRRGRDNLGQAKDDNEIILCGTYVTHLSPIHCKQEVVGNNEQPILSAETKNLLTGQHRDLSRRQQKATSCQLSCHGGQCFQKMFNYNRTMPKLSLLTWTSVKSSSQPRLFVPVNQSLWNALYLESRGSSY